MHHDQNQRQNRFPKRENAMNNTNQPNLPNSGTSTLTAV